MAIAQLGATKWRFRDTIRGMIEACLVLEDGTVLGGDAFGAPADAVFELVFNTSMTGYQEILTDPSYRGQGVLFTAPHIGNVGINPEDYESSFPQVSAVVVRALSPVVSNWRAAASGPETSSPLELAGWLARHGIPGIAGIDTRSLTRKLRDGGTLRAALSTQGASAARLLEMARAWPGLDGRDMVQEVTCPEPYAWMGDAADHWVAGHGSNVGTLERWNARQRDYREREIIPGGLHVVAYDFGAKRNILRHLAARGARITVVPAHTSSDETLALRPDGVFLSNGPGDPAGLPYAVAAVRGLLDSGVPILGICLGHQLLGLALGGSTERLKFGHHGANHPVQDLRTGRVLITAQNHNYCVAADSLNPAEVEISHLSLNDGSVEGLRMQSSGPFAGRHPGVLSVQFHPEAAAGPHDAHGLFDEFFEMMR